MTRGTSGIKSSWIFGTAMADKPYQGRRLCYRDFHIWHSIAIDTAGYCILLLREGKVVSKLESL